jgi:hypothetical protein
MLSAAASRLGRNLVLAGVPLTGAAAAIAWIIALPVEPPRPVSRPSWPAVASVAPPRAAAPAPPATKPRAVTPERHAVPASPVASAVATTSSVMPAAGAVPAGAAVPLPCFVPGRARGGVPSSASIAYEPEARAAFERSVDELEREVLARGETLARLQRIDLALAREPRERAVVLVERLLDRGEAGDEEARAFRVALISRFALLAPHPAVEPRLIRLALDQDARRAERIAAIEGLRRSPSDAMRSALSDLANGAGDEAVRSAARRALGPSQG